MQLFNYQKEAVHWLSQRDKAYLALDMGLGKTAITLTSLKERNLFPVMVVCPAIAKNHWANEVQKWAPGETAYIQSYDSIDKLREHIPKCKSIVFDEAHFLKTPGAVRTKKALLSGKALARSFKNIIFISGTPAPNNVSELWPVLVVLGVVRETFLRFCTRYCIFERVFLPGGRSIARVSGNDLAKIPELKERMKDVIYRKKRSEVELDLPQVIFSEYPVTAPPAKHLEKKEEENFTSTFKAELPVDLHQLQALAPSIASLRKFHAMRKIKPVLELLDADLQSAKDEKFVVFAHHRVVLETLASNYPGSAVITGKTPDKQREYEIIRFQRDPSCRIFFGSILAVGTAINLHAARNVIFVEQDYVPGNNQQALSRVVRIGQESNKVFARYITLNDSYIDQRVSEILAKKMLELKELFG